MKNIKNQIWLLSVAGGNCMDSMMGIFYEESSRIIYELRNDFADYENIDMYGLDFIQEVFRVVHTLKANATMMLFDGIANVSKKFESLLYCFRNGPKVIEDTNLFDEIFCGYIDYVEEELSKIADGRQAEQPNERLIKAIDEYIRLLKGQYKIDESGIKVGQVSETPNKKTRQIYYIPGASSSEPDNKKNSKDAYNDKGSDGVIVVKTADINKIQHNITKLEHILSEIKSISDGNSYTLNKSEIKKLFEIDKELNDVTSGFVKGDFSVVAKKMDMLVDEMSENLHKNVKLLVKGENIMIDKAKRDKISTALIHIIRNSVDHGIEDFETRERLGKSPMGLIKLEFKQKEGRIKIIVDDDGAGISSKEVLKAAKKAGVLKKKPEEYTRDEILNLLLINGVSTTNVPNDYSGRGVGMDVINHNIQEIGGKLKITSEKNLGTKIEIEI